MYNQYKKFSIETNTDLTMSRFIETDKLPTNIPVSTSINFIHLGSEVILQQDEDGLWGPVHCKISLADNWRNELKSETQEAVGISIDRVTLCGYILNEHKEDTLKTMTPVCYSYCHDVSLDWHPKGATEREIYSHSNVKKHLAERNDGDQMLEVYVHIHKQLSRDLRVEFTFSPDEIPNDIFVTSAMVLCIDSDNRICIVKDGLEDFYSLPGGGRMLRESPLDCAKRELHEEAQVIGKNFKIFGSIVINFYMNDVLVSKMQQTRYICDVDVMETFIPYKDGFETDERVFVHVKQLLTLVKQLKNDTGKHIVAHLIQVRHNVSTKT